MLGQGPAGKEKGVLEQHAQVGRAGHRLAEVLEEATHLPGDGVPDDLSRPPGKCR